MNQVLHVKGVKNIVVIWLMFSFCFSFSQEDTKTELDSIYALQGKLYRSKDYTEIIELSNSARSIPLKTTQDSITFARIIAYIGYANNKFNNYHDSVKGFEEALTYIPSSKDESIVRTKIITLYELLRRYYSLRRYKKALAVANEAERLIDENDVYNVRRKAQFYQRKFRIYSALGFYDKARLEVDKIKRVTNEMTDESIESQRSAWIRYYRADLLADYYEATYLKEKHNNDISYLLPFKDKILLNLNKLDSIYKNTAYLVHPKTKKHVWDLSIYVGTLYYASDFFKELEEYKTALNYIDKTISLSEKSQEPNRNITEFLRFRALLMRELGDTKSALEALTDLEKNYDANSFNSEELLTFKGHIYAQEKQLDSALHYYNRALRVMHNAEEELANNFSNFSTRFQFPNDCNLMQQMSDNLYDYFPENEEALRASKDFNQLAYNEFITNHRNFDLSRGNEQLYLSVITPILAEDTEMFSDRKAFVSDLENISNRIAWQQFAQSRDMIQLPVVDSLEQIEYTIRKQLVNAKKEREQKNIIALEKELSEYQIRVAKEFPKISDFSQDNFNISDFQNHLKDDEIALKYIFLTGQLAIIQITNKDVLWEQRPWTEKEESLLQKQLNAIKNPVKGKTLDEALTLLLLPENVLKYKQLTIVPDQPIYYLPFETLWYKDDYLVTTKNIRYSSHLRFAFLKSKKEHQKNPEVTIFAPNYPKAGADKLATRSASVFLEGAQKEAKMLEGLFSTNAFIGDEATKDNFVNYKSKGNILHMAMHATVDENTPELSHFNFSNNQKLFLEELYALKVPADLAVLGACNTAVGKEDGALTINSLHRAFNYAGTTATIASLWEVPDETTSKIMISFYTYLKERKPKSVALQQAKIDYLNSTSNDKLKHPYYWAGFVLYGTDAPIVTSSNTTVWYLFVVALVVFGLFFIFRKRRTNQKL